MKGTFRRHSERKKLIRSFGRNNVKCKITAKLKWKYNIKTHYKIPSFFPSMDILERECVDLILIQP
jgi:hypothetical protein